MTLHALASALTLALFLPVVGNISAHASHTSARWVPVLRDVRTVVSKQPQFSALPPDFRVQAANNNVGITLHDGRLFMAWRTAPTHFASRKTRLAVASSADLGRSWEIEQVVHNGADLREPHLVSLGGMLHLYFFEAGTHPLKFQPRKMWRMTRLGVSHTSGRPEWSEAVPGGEDGQVPWDLKVREGKLWMTSYRGNHYSTGRANVSVYLQTSEDGVTFHPSVTSQESVVYQGGVSEVGFEFDDAGALWGVTRNEDGDRTGFGSHVVRADGASLWKWEFPRKSNAWRFDSPKMFKHEGELYLVARRDPEKPFDREWNWLPFTLRRLLYLKDYSFRPKLSSLFRLDRESRSLVHLMDLPGTGDTAFPSIVQLEPHRFLIANYTSPEEHRFPNWISGQVSPIGTRIYLAELEFTR